MKRLLGCVALGLGTIAASAQWTNPSDDVPAYNASAPVKPLPPVLSGNQLTGIYFSHPYQVTAYKMAANIPESCTNSPAIATATVRWGITACTAVLKALTERPAQPA